VRNPSRDDIGSHPGPSVVVGRFEPLQDHGLVCALQDHGVEVLESGLEGAALERVVARCRPRLAILADTVEPELLSRLVSGEDGVKVLILTSAPRPLYDELLCATGATSVAVSAPLADIVAAVHLGAGGHPELRDRLSRHNPREVGLTRKQRELFELFRVGYGYAQACRELGIEESTARTHARRIFAKLGVASKAELLGMTLPRERAAAGLK